MRKTLIVTGVAASLAACGSSNEAANQAPVNQAAAKPKAAFCFFKEDETNGWTASVDKDGNVVIKAKAHVKDSRYKAVLGQPQVTGTAATIAPTITPNDTAYAAENDTWDLQATIPNSAAVETVTVDCGDKTIAQLQVPRKK